MIGQLPNTELQELQTKFKDPEAKLSDKVSLLQKVSNELDHLFSDQIINEIIQADILEDVVAICNSPIESEDDRRAILHFFATLTLAAPTKTKLLLDLGVLTATLAVLCPPITPEAAKQVLPTLSYKGI